MNGASHLSFLSLYQKHLRFVIALTNPNLYLNNAYGIYCFNIVGESWHFKFSNKIIFSIWFFVWKVISVRYLSFVKTFWKIWSSLSEVFTNRLNQKMVAGGRKERIDWSKEQFVKSWGVTEQKIQNVTSRVNNFMNIYKWRVNCKVKKEISSRDF